MRSRTKVCLSRYLSCSLLTIQVINYVDTVHTRPVMSEVESGYLKKLLPDRPSEDGEKWQEIQKDIESKIMPGMTHW